MSAKELFLEEIKQQYNKEFEIKSSLEGKANNILTISGTVGTLLFGFGTFLMDKLGSKYEFITILSILLMAGIFANIASIFLAALSFRIKSYRFAMGGKLNNSAIDQYKNAEINSYYDTIIRTYIKCIEVNSEINSKKTTKIEISQWVFLAGIFVIPAIIAVLFTKLP